MPIDKCYDQNAPVEQAKKTDLINDKLLNTTEFRPNNEDSQVFTQSDTSVLESGTKLDNYNAHPHSSSLENVKADSNIYQNKNNVKTNLVEIENCDMLKAKIDFIIKEKVYFSIYNSQSNPLTITHIYAILNTICRCKSRSGYMMRLNSSERRIDLGEIEMADSISGKNIIFGKNKTISINKESISFLFKVQLLAKTIYCGCNKFEDREFLYSEIKLGGEFFSPLEGSTCNFETNKMKLEDPGIIKYSLPLIKKDTAI